MLNETLRSRWFSACLHAGLWLLLGLAVIGVSFGGRAPRFVESESNPADVTTPVPVAKLQALFSPESWPKKVIDPAGTNIFATTQFMPQVVTPVTPTTRKVDLTYQGYYETSGGPRRVMVRLGEAIIAVPVGGVVVTNLWVSDAAFQTLTLTNSAKQTNVLALNVKKEVEVPLK